MLLVGCGRSDVIDDTPPASTPQPVVAACTSTCTSSPPSLATPLQVTPDGRPLHWATCAGCVRVSFDPQLSPSDALTLFASVKDWQRAAGASLCV